MAGITSLIPLVVLFAFIGGFGWIGYQMYLYSQDLKNHGKAHMQKKGFKLSRDGVRVDVKNKNQPDVSDKSAGVLKKVWDASGTDLNNLKAPNGSRPTSSRSSSGTARPTTTSRSPSTQSIPKTMSP